MRWIHLWLVLPLLLAATPSGGAAITVVVNEQVLPITPPAVQISGRVLLPMRVVFEALGATVTWEAATQTAVAVRENVTVRLTINSAQARVNERIVILDVPPQLLGGSTYVPVRFPAEAFGAEVRWEGATQTVHVQLAGSPASPPVVPPQISNVTGVLAAVEGNQLMLALADGLMPLSPLVSTIILRNGKQVTVTGLQAGDQVEVQFDARGNPTLIKATYETLTGKVVAKVPNQIMLDSRPEQPLVVDPGVVVTLMGTNTRLPYADLKNGDQVTVRLTPGTNRVYGIVLRTAAPPPPVTTGPVITAFTGNATRPLRAGEVLQVTLQGTAGGAACFELLGQPQQIALPEVQPGLYRADYTVPAGLNVLGVPLIGNLKVGEASAPAAESADPVTLESVAPQVVIHGPPAGETIHSRLPDLAVEFSDEHGSGVDWARCRVTLRGPAGPLPLGLIRVGRLLVLSFAPLPVGSVTVTADGWDRAGNHRRQERGFTVVGTPAPQNRLWVSHNAAGRVLMPGDQLVVTVTGPAGGVGTFSLGNWQKDRPLAESRTLPGTYRGTFVVPELTADRQVAVSAALIGPGGAVWTGTATPQVALATRRELRPTLLVPAAGAAVGQQTRVEGLTEPYAEVVCTLSWQAVVPGSGPQLGRIVQLRLLANEAGRFAAGPVRLYGPANAPVTYTLTAIADQGGRQSEEASLQFSR